MDTYLHDYIGKLSRFKHRYSGTRENWQAVDMIQDHFVSNKWRVSVEKFKVHGNMASAILLHILPVLALFWVPVQWGYWNMAALAVYGFILVSFWGEMTLMFHWLRQLIPSHKTANLEARLEEEQAGRQNKKEKLYIICAHHDSPKTGWLYDEKLSDPVATLLAKAPPPLDRFFMLPFLAVVVLGIGLLMRVLGAFPPFFIYPVYVATGLLVITVVSVFQWGVSAPSSGANDNGSGILVLMELARRLRSLPAGSSVRLLATGAEEVGFQGIIDYLNKHRTELQGKDVMFINIECVGGGELHWGTCEGFLAKTKYPAESILPIEKLELSGAIQTLPRTYIMSHTDGAPPARNGFKILTLIGLKDSAIPVNYHKASDTFDRLETGSILEAAGIVEKIVTEGR